MRYVLVNPNWDFKGSIYFGCREPHLPVELGYSKSILEREGHEALIIDAHLHDLSSGDIRSLVENFSPNFTVVTTAPTYLFWRCPPPELKAPQEVIQNLRGVGGVMVAVGPHGSTTPEAAIRKLGVDVVLRGELEDILPRLADTSILEIPSACHIQGGALITQGQPHAADMGRLPALHWPSEAIERHSHHHHRFDASPTGPGAEMETSRGCPYRCDFCAKENFRRDYRIRPLSVVEEELDGLLAENVEYIYFIDEIFLPNKQLLELFSHRRFKFGVQTRIDLWSREMIELLGRAGCVSIEAGVESISEEGRRMLNKNCVLRFEEITDRLIFAKKHVPFVQANLIATPFDDLRKIEDWRNTLINHGVWANKPVPLFPYPGSPIYFRLWGAPDNNAWERAHEYYLGLFSEFSDIQEQNPTPLSELELFEGGKALG
jgi:B12-binding domain/radical SAM domain protein of rhizo-twelve system